jgi:hypothetical protein
MYPGDPIIDPLSVSPRASAERESAISQIEHLDARDAIQALGHKEIARLQVSMDDADGVSLDEGFAGLEHGSDRVSDGHRTLATENLAEVTPREILHDHVRLAARHRADVEHLRHVFAR